MVTSAIIHNQDIDIRKEENSKRYFIKNLTIKSMYS